jgi:hypothetical protein
MKGTIRILFAALVVVSLLMLKTVSGDAMKVAKMTTAGNASA